LFFTELGYFKKETGLKCFLRLRWL